MSLRDCYNRELGRRKAAAAKDKNAKPLTPQEREAETLSIVQSAINERRAELRKKYLTPPPAKPPALPPAPKKTVEPPPFDL